METDTINAEPNTAELPTVAYFRLDNEIMPDMVISKIEKDASCRLVTLETWCNFLSYINSHPTGGCPSLLLLDFQAHALLGITPAELSSALVTINRCTRAGNKPPIGVVIGSTVAPEVVKELHNADISGLVPASTVFGYENTSHAIQELLMQHHYWPKKVTDMVSKVAVKSGPPGVRLTERQKQVLTLICNRGLSNKKIASTLKISESTVKVHISAIMKEYGVRNRTQLVLASTSSLKP